MKFYLGIHNAAWIDDPRTISIPLFISMNQLWRRRKPFKAWYAQVGIDSGGFSELRLNGEWTKTADEYLTKLTDLERLGLPYEWAAPQDWMVEPFMLERTGLTLEEHQKRTVENYLDLSSKNARIIPVLQGWTLDDYFECFELYEAHGVNLRDQKLVGVGSVCRRQGTKEIERIMRSLHAKDLKLHGFGVKTQGLENYSECLTSSDSLAWSYSARYSDKRCWDCQQRLAPPKNCANCLQWGLDWRHDILQRIDTASPPRSISGGGV